MRQRILFGAVLLAVATNLTGCATEQQERPKAFFPHEHSDEWLSGHVDGCMSGKAAAGKKQFWKEQSTEYGSSSDYTMGWDTGFTTCKKEAMER